MSTNTLPVTVKMINFTEEDQVGHRRECTEAMDVLRDSEAVVIFKDRDDVPAGLTICTVVFSFDKFVWSVDWSRVVKLFRSRFRLSNNAAIEELPPVTMGDGDEHPIQGTWRLAIISWDDTGQEAIVSEVQSIINALMKRY